MFKKILIANRGEIACRVMETAQKMGVGTVAVFSDADRHARHVAMADQAVHIGGSAPADSYLRGDVIIQAALDTGAQAIHPGYGFLSENPEFVEAVEAAGLVFIGPSATAIRAMGLKDAAKVLMAASGVPVVPGYHGENQDPAHLAKEAAAIGWPVLIKAVAGGGGKGMRLVETAEGFADALDSARGEAETAFGNGDVLIEKYITSPRHIEVQVFGDGTDAVHLFERDCSLQRRHQKVIEEAPAPGMTPEIRAAMGAAAVRAAKAVGYAGAGTVEFIVDGKDGLREDGFWFMEMNTRLQVEHPVTEAITGVDLVDWQMRVAAGAPLPAAQEQLSIQGHSFEARLYAEDVAAGFLPATGRLAHLAFPQNARIDTGVRSGDEISPFYDPMIAKITSHGATREIALAQLDRALSDTHVCGLTTNVAFLRALCGHADFAQGRVDTGLIARDLEMLTTTPRPCSKSQGLAVLAQIDAQNRGPDAGLVLWGALERDVAVLWQDSLVEARVRNVGPSAFIVTLGDAQHGFEFRDNAWWIDGAKTRAQIKRHSAGVSVFFGNSYHFETVDPLDRGENTATSSDLIQAPMPGLVKALFVAPGDKVAQGDRLAVLEAMKMEHGLLAGRDGTVANVLVAQGDQVVAGAGLIQLEEEDSP